MRDLTVPSGRPVSSAIWLWDFPRKKRLAHQDRLFLGQVHHRLAHPFVALLPLDNIIRRFRLGRLQRRILGVEQGASVAPEARRCDDFAQP